MRRDVVQTGLYLSVLGPSYVYVRYRCGRCKRMGEKLVEQGEWDPTVLQAGRKGPSEDELRRFSDMGDITADEVIDFHFAIESLASECEEEAGLA